MSRLLQIFGASILLFSALAACGDIPILDARDNGPPAAGLQAAKRSLGTARSLGSMPLDGRSLIDSWLGRRQFVCNNAGYSPCPDDTSCCPTGDGCCPSVCCKAGDNCCGTDGCVSPGAACCSGGYTCPSGWDCCTEGYCFPKGGQCCTTGYYCEPGNQCVLFDGVQKCCTNDLCTAYVSSGMTVTQPGVGAGNPTATGVVTVPTTHSTTTTKAGSQTTLAGSFEYYYFTITWYYISWYWTYETIITPVAVSTFTQVTTTTVFSVYATDTLAASESALSYSLTFSGPTPAAATSLPPSPTGTSGTGAPGVGIGLGGSTSSHSSSTSTRTSSAASTSSANAGGGSSTGAKSAATKWNVGWGMAMFMVFSLASGILMVWL